MHRWSCLLRCRSWRLILTFDLSRAAIPHIDDLGATDRSRPSIREPSFNLGEVPNDFSRRKRITARTLSALLHLDNCAVGKRPPLLELLLSDGAGVRT